MLEHYFVRYQTVERIRACWLATPIERYVDWLEEEGYAARNVHRRVPLLCRFAAFTAERGATSLEQASALVEDFVAHYVAHYVDARPHSACTPATRRRIATEARNPVNQMLHVALPGHRGGGRQALPDPFQNEAPGFFAYLREERGLRETSVLHYRHYLNRFAAFLARHQVGALGHVSAPTLAAFVVDSAPALSRNSRRNLCATMKVFLRYCYRERLTASDLSGAVEMPRSYRLAELPRSIGWDEVRRMLDAVDRRSPRGIRDYAILLLLVTYGLRAHEVAAMSLDDLDWSRDRLRVPERKAGHWTVYPLAGVVGEAIIAYLKEVRPNVAERRVFLRVLAPVRALRAKAIGHSVAFYLRKAGIEVRRPGAHTLRHTCVQRLVDGDLSLKTIGDYVGHRSASSTEIYTKVATEALREVALGDGELL